MLFLPQSVDIMEYESCVQSGHFILVRMSPFCFDILHCCLYARSARRPFWSHAAPLFFVFKSKIQASHRFQFPPTKQGCGSVHISKKSDCLTFSAELLLEHIQQKKCDCLSLFCSTWWSTSNKSVTVCLILPLTCPVSLSVQFKMVYIYICAQKSPYVLHPISQKCPQCCLWNGSSVHLIDNGPWSTSSESVAFFFCLQNFCWSTSNKNVTVSLCLQHFCWS